MSGAAHEQAGRRGQSSRQRNGHSQARVRGACHEECSAWVYPIPASSLPPGGASWCVPQTHTHARARDEQEQGQETNTTPRRPVGGEGGDNGKTEEAQEGEHGGTRGAHGTQLCLRQGGGGREVLEGGGLGPKKFVYQKWPDKILPMVNFVFSHDRHFGLGGALLLRCRATLILPCGGGGSAGVRYAWTAAEHWRPAAAVGYRPPGVA